MEQIKQGKITINKGEKVVTIFKKSTIEDNNEDFWSFIDSLVVKGYKIENFTSTNWGLLTILTKT